MTLLVRSNAPIGIQRRMVELGRLRFGEKVENRDPKKKAYPRSLDKWRMTSASRSILEAAREVYGGKPVKEWTDAPDEGMFELYTAASELKVVLPPILSADDGTPTYPYSQSYELWDGPTCARRCDGRVATVPKGRGLDNVPCICAQTEEARACKVVTRISVMLPDLPGIGVWRMDTHGEIAASYLPGTLDMLAIAATNRIYIPAKLRLEKRSSRKRDEKGEVETRRFVVVVLDPEITTGQLLSAGQGASSTIFGIHPEIAPVKDKPKLLETASLDDAAPLVKETGAWGEEVAVEAGVPIPVDSDATFPAQPPQRASGDVEGDPWMKAIHAIARERGLDHAGIHQAAAGFFGARWTPSSSLKDLNPLERGRFRQALEAIPIPAPTTDERQAETSLAGGSTPPAATTPPEAAAGGAGEATADPAPPAVEQATAGSGPTVAEAGGEADTPPASASPPEAAPVAPPPDDGLPPMAGNVDVETNVYRTAQRHGIHDGTDVDAGWKAIDALAAQAGFDPDSMTDEQWTELAAQIAAGVYDAVPRPRSGG